MSARAMSSGERGARILVRALAIAFVLLGANGSLDAQQLSATLEPGSSSAGDYRNGTLFCEVGDRVQLVLEVTGEGATDVSPPEAPQVDGLKIEVSGSQSTRTTISGTGARRWSQSTYY